MKHAPPQLIGLRDVLDDPYRVAEHLRASGTIYGLTDIDVRIADRHLVCYWLTLDPWAGPAAEGYPTERVAVSTWATGAITAVPVDARNRDWLHRNPSVDFSRWGSLRRTLFASTPPAVRDTAEQQDRILGDIRRLGDLCLWYPNDPRSLRWEWDDGLVAYITIVHRHLQAEEFWRRTGTWPAEDAPHGDGPHPIRTEAMRLAALERAR